MISGPPLILYTKVYGAVSSAPARVITGGVVVLRQTVVVPEIVAVGKAARFSLEFVNLRFGSPMEAEALVLAIAKNANVLKNNPINLGRGELYSISEFFLRSEIY